MKRVLSILLSLPLCGCLSPAIPSVTYWLMDYEGVPQITQGARYGVVRLSQVVVNQPYAGERIVVLRADGSVALDGNNLFAASPTSLLKATCLEGMRSSGLFEAVVESSSGVSTTHSVEIYVKRLALDCRQTGLRQALAEVQICLIAQRKIVMTASGSGTADAAEGNFGAAFSKAVSQAVFSALAGFR